MGDMKLRPRDIISYQGKDHVVEGILTYKLGGKTYRLARAVDGPAVLWVEPLMNDADDRLILFHEVKDLPVGTPPPSTISYKGQSYLPRHAGVATVDVDGVVSDREAGNCELWRYRGAGDIFLQIEAWPAGTVVLAGESVHKDMVEIYPAP
jgi:hypothetical protein